MNCSRWLALVFLAFPPLALAQLGSYKKEAGIRVALGNVPEIVRYGPIYRIYFCGQGGIQSATSSDGLTFTVEPGVRVAAGAQGGSESIVCDPSVVTYLTGQVRMYYKGADGPGGPGQANHRIFSALSSDGVDFVKEGLRYENLGAPDYGWTSVPDAVMMKDGRVRVFFTGGAGIESIVSKDGLAFTPDPGVRIAGGVDPDVQQKGDGTFLLFYGQGGVPPQSIAVATSSDGLTFTSKGTVLTAGAPCDSGGTLDPTVVKLPSGRYRLYYGGMGSCGNVTLSAISPLVIKPYPVLGD